MHNGKKIHEHFTTKILSKRLKHFSPLKPCTVRTATLLSTSIGDPSASQCISVLLYCDDTENVRFLLNTILPRSSAKATGCCSNPLLMILCDTTESFTLNDKSHTTVCCTGKFHCNTINSSNRNRINCKDLTEPCIDHAQKKKAILIAVNHGQSISCLILIQYTYLVTQK